MFASMPGREWKGPVPPPTEERLRIRANLERHVRMLTETIGPRNLTFHVKLQEASRYLQAELGGVNIHTYEADGLTYEILETPCEGPFMVVGAHYDSVYTCPGANDNASGVAAVLELARLLQGEPGYRFVLFPNEEPPYYKTQDMGSVRYVKHLLRAQEPVTSMLCLETVGYYSGEPGSQKAPFPGLPTVGDFVAIVGNAASAFLVRELVERWRAPLSCLGLAPLPVTEPFLLQAGMDMSDHAAFWEAGIPAAMVTDTVFYRYEHYHTPEDTWEKLTYEPFARMVEGLATVLRDGSVVSR